jgi:hypothetical protein
MALTFANVARIVLVVAELQGFFHNMHLQQYTTAAAVTSTQTRQATYGCEEKQVLPQLLCM